MVTVRIGDSEKSLEEAEPHWITQQINQRREDGITSICVKVIIREGSVEMILSTPGCGGGVGRPGQPSSEEKDIIDLWQKQNLNEYEFTPGNLVAFIQQLKKMI